MNRYGIIVEHRSKGIYTLETHDILTFAKRACDRARTGPERDWYRRVWIKDLWTGEVIK